MFSADEKEAEIKLGILTEAPTALSPTYELWTERREAWLRPSKAQSNSNRIDLAWRVGGSETLASEHGGVSSIGNACLDRIPSGILKAITLADATMVLAVPTTSHRASDDATADPKTPGKDKRARDRDINDEGKVW